MILRSQIGLSVVFRQRLLLQKSFAAYERFCLDSIGVDEDSKVKGGILK